MPTKWAVLTCWLVMTLGVAGASRAELTEADNDLLGSVFAQCGTTVWAEYLFGDVPNVAPVSTDRRPFEGTGRLLASAFSDTRTVYQLRRYFAEHFDRDRMQQVHAWCDGEPADSTVLAPTLNVLRAPVYDKTDPKSPRWQIARRVARAQRAPEIAEGIVAAWMEPFVEGLKEGFAQAGAGAAGEPVIAEAVRNAAALRQEAAGLEEAVVQSYVRQLAEVPEADLASFAAFWESDLGRWYTALQWDGARLLLADSGKAAGLALAGIAAREILGEAPPAEPLPVESEERWGPLVQVEDDEEALLIAYSWCGPRVMIEGFAEGVAPTPPLDTASGPFADLEGIFEESFAAAVHHEAFWAWFEEHADRQRMSAYQKWCVHDDDIWRTLSIWPTFERLQSSHYERYRRDNPPSERRQKALARLIAARGSVDFPYDATAAWVLPFFDELRKGLTAAGLDAGKLPGADAAIQKDRRETVEKLVFDFYLYELREITNEDLEDMASFFETDTGRGFTALHWEGLKTLLAAGGRNAGKALAEHAAARLRDAKK
ncbi:MAG TPA: hypothetical protein VMW27_29520 [Thermoanaerobaculia bacterium]|nr:hypothetical protein [Thermoanaerobaculia bacterium]